MRNAGIAVLVGSIAVTAVLIIIWLLGLVAHIGGGLIHLLLVLAILVGPAGVTLGVILLFVAGARSRKP